MNEDFIILNGVTAPIRTPKNVSWQPQPDITAHELSLALIPLLMGFSRPGIHVEDTIANLPENARRHFVIT